MRNDAATPAARIMYVDWNPTWLRSTPGCPMAYTRTATRTISAVTSMIADSRSATSVMPIGAGQSPACTTTIPRSSTRTRMAIEIGTSTASVVTPIMRWAARDEPVRMHKRGGQQRQQDGQHQQRRHDETSVSGESAPTLRSSTSSWTSSSRVSSQLR